MYRELLANGTYDNATEYAQLLAFAKAEYEEVSIDGYISWTREGEE